MKRVASWIVLYICLIPAIPGRSIHAAEPPPDPFPPVCTTVRNKMNTDTTLVQRVIGLDAHPDTFTAAALQGPTPATAVVQRIFNKVPMAQLQRWATKHTNPEDLIVLEASGNSFQVVRTLARIDQTVRPLVPSA